MACSRMPKWKLRPASFPGAEVAAGAVEGQQASWSRGPGRPSRPSSQGIRLATWLSTLPDETRLAMPLASAGKGATSASQSFGSSPAQEQLELLGFRRILPLVLGELRLPGLPQACGRARRCSGGSGRGPRRERGTWPPAASRRPPWSGGLPPRPAARRGRSCVLCLFGAPQAMTLRTMISVGRSPVVLEAARSPGGRPPGR